MLKTMTFRSMLMAVACAISASAYAMADEPRKVDVPAGELTVALRSLAEQSGVEFVYSVDQLKGVRTNGVQGDYTAEKAVTKLLEGTELKLTVHESGALLIAPPATKTTTTNHTSAGPQESLFALEEKELARSSTKREGFWSRLRLAQTGTKGHSDPFSAEDESLREKGQETNDAGATSAASGAKIEQILVTARRREEDAQTVPISITAVSQQTLQDNNVATIGDLQYLVPSMSALSGTTRDQPNIFIRGQGQNRNGGAPGVVAYINDVPIPTNFQSRLAGGPGLFFDLDSVQVLKGPQGTLFGRNSVGGALLLQTARPQNELGGRVQLGYGNHESREIDAAIDLPVVDEKLLTRFAFNGQKRDGFTRLLGTPSHPDGIDADDREYWSVRGSVTFRPNDRFLNDTIVTHSEFDTNGSPLILTEVNPSGLLASVPGYLALAQQQIALGIRTAMPVGVDIELRGSVLSANNITQIDLTDNLTFRNILGYTKSNAAEAADADTSVLPLLDTRTTPLDETRRQFTEEVQLLGRSFGERLDWTVGAFYLDRDPPDDYVVGTQVTFGTRADFASKTGEESKAVFAQGTYDLSALMTGLSVTAGLRYTWDSAFTSSRGRAPGVGGPVICTEPRVNCDFITNAELDFSALTWTFGLDYQATPDTLLYFASRRGYRVGGINGPDPAGNPLPGIEPEYVTDYEVGIKSDWTVANIPIRTNVALYHQDYTDIQVQQISFINNGFNIFTQNAASARLSGAELEAQMLLTDNLQLGASFAYMDFEYTEFGPNVAGITQLELGRTAGRPPRKYGVNANYHLPLSSHVGDVSVQANWNWQEESGDRFLNVGGLVPSFGLLNLSANWNGIFGGPVDASLFASNALDEVYSQGGFGFYNALGFTDETFGEPRMYGVRLRYRFGDSK